MKLSKKTVVIMGLSLPMILAGCGEQHVHEFDYENPTWSWTEGYSAATVTFKCTGCEEQVETHEATVTVDDKDSKCSEVTQDTYTASVTVGERTFTDTKRVDNELAEHVYDYEHPIWQWADDKSSATVKFDCNNCDAQSTPVTATVSVDDQDPTCLTGATDTYTATVTVGERTFSDTKTSTDNPLGHNYTSIRVGGTYATEYNALSTFNKEGMEVYKVCERDNAEELVALADVEIEYQNGTALHVGDTKVTIKAAGFSKEITVTVNAIKVTKPTADTTTFVYDGNEKTYTVASSELYSVTGTTATTAGNHTVIVSLNNKVDYTWDDDSTADLTFTFAIGKGQNTISGLEDTYETTCNVMPTVTGVTSTFGIPSVAVYNDAACENAVTADQLSVGTYYVKASVEGTDDFEAASKVATLTVSHGYGEEALDTNKIGVVSRSCACGDVDVVRLATPADIDFTQNTFGNLFSYHPTGSWINTSTWEPSTITEEPTWNAWGHNAVATKDTLSYTQAQEWCGARKFVLPKIDYTKFTKVSFDMNITVEPGSTWKTVACDFDTIKNDDGSFVRISNMKDNTGVLSVTHKTNGDYVMNIKYGEVNESKVITDTDILNGNAPLHFYDFVLGGGSVPSIVLSNLQLINETEHTFDVVPSLSVIGEANSVCTGCGETTEGTLEAGTVIGFKSSLYGAAQSMRNDLIGQSDGDGTRGFVNGIKYTLDRDTQANQDITLTLPRINFSKVGSASMRFVNNSGSLKLGFAKDNVIDVTFTNADACFVLDATLVDGKIYCSLTSPNANKYISAVIEDADVINGTKGMSLYYTGALYRNLFLSPVTVGAYVDAQRYNGATYANKSFTSDWGVAGATQYAWGHIGGTATYLAGISAGAHTMYLGAVNFAAAQEVSFKAWVDGAVTMSLDSENSFTKESGKRCFIFKGTYDAETKSLTLSILPYEAGENNFDVLDEANVVSTTITDPAIIYGCKSAEIGMNFTSGGSVALGCPIGK